MFLTRQELNWLGFIEFMCLRNGVDFVSFLFMLCGSLCVCGSGRGVFWVIKNLIGLVNFLSSLGNDFIKIWKQILKEDMKR